MRTLSFASRSSILSFGLVAACSVPNVDFAGTGDGGTDAIDAPTEVTLVVSTGTATVAEGGVATFTIQLSAPPAAAILVSVDSGDENRLGVAPGTVSLDAANWNQPRTITLSGREDADTEDEAITVSLSSSVGDDSVAVTVADNDALSMVVSPAGGLDVTEGATAPLTVRLSAQPSGPITVTVASSDMLAATASPTNLNFGVGNWDLDQTLVVSGVQDADIANANPTLTLTPSGGLDDLVVPILVIDDDVLGILPSTTNLGTLAEGGTGSFTVRLTQQPPGPVSVGVMSSDIAILTATPPTIGFTTADWDTPRTVNVTLPQDIDTTDEAATISLTATGLTTRAVAAAVADDDTQVIVATPNPVALDEGMTRTIDVHLAFQPASDLTLTVTSLNATVATASTTMLTFTPTNYAANQQVTVTAVQDADALAGMTAVRLESVADSLTRDVAIAVTDDDQLLIETSAPTVTLTESGMTTFNVRLTAMPGADVTVNTNSGDTTAATLTPPQLTFTTTSYNVFQPVTVNGVANLDLANEALVLTLTAAGVPPKTVDAIVTDDDMQRVVVSTATTSVNEGGTGQVGVSLGFQPAGSVVVTVMSSDGTAATVLPAMLTFMPGTYATPQNITITGVEDPDTADDTVLINATAPSAMAAAVTVTVNDDDALGIETSVTTTSVGEAGTQTVGVRLTAQPPGTVTVMVMSSDTTAATVAPAMLSFDGTDWNVYKNVTLTGVNDADAISESITVTASSPPLTPRTVTVTVTDNDTQDILLTVTNVSLTESGTSTFGVRLAAMPPGDVTVAVASGNTNKATATPTPLTFTPGNYNVNQTVTVSGVQDLDLANDTVPINMSSTGLTTRAVNATVNDEDTQEVISSSAGPFTVNEGGGPVLVGFYLRYIPTGSVTVTVTSGSTGLTVMPTSLVFNAGNYSSAQNVMMTAPQDADAADITTTVTGSSPGANSTVVNVIVDDDDVLGLDTTTTSLGVNEGGTNTFGVRLTAQPTGNTSVMVASNDGLVATVLPTTLSFNTTDWNVYKTVTVTGVQDDNLLNDGATVTVSSAGLTSRNVGVTVTDDDLLTILTSFSMLTVNEGSTNTFTVRLSHMPTAAVAVTAASSDAGAASVPPAPGNVLNFTTGNWATPQNLAITGVSDSDAADESVIVTLTSPGVPNRTVTVAVPDDEIVLGDLSVQMMPATGATFTFLGNGFTAAVSATLAGTAVSNPMVLSATTLSATAPNHVAPSPRFADARVTKGAISQIIARAMYRGNWVSAINGMGGGAILSLASSGSTVFAGTENGVYRSTDGGVTWTAINNGLIFTVTGIAVDPTNVDRIYASTGGGVHVTTNGGASWTRTGMFAASSCVAMAPGFPQVLLACYGTTVQRTLNGGAAWTDVLLNAGTLRNISWGLNGQTAWVASSTGVRITGDQGTSWTPVNSGLPVNINGVSSSPDDIQTAYAISNNGLYRTQNGGNNWNQLGSVGGATTTSAVHAPNTSNVFVATTSGVYRYNGASFSQVGSGIPSQALSTLAIHGIGSSEVYAGTAAWGVYRSINQGVQWNASSVGLDAYDVNSFTVHPTVSGTVFATPSNMGIWKSTDRGATWAISSSGFSGNAYGVKDVAFTPGQPSIMWAAMLNNGVRKSTDGGNFWSTTGLSGVDVDQVVAKDASTAYAVGVSGVRKTIDGGTTWTLMNNGLPGTNIRSVMISDDNAVYIADNAGLVYKSTNEGASWVSTPSSAAINPYRLTFEPVTGTIYVQSNSGLYRSTDDGASWSAVAGNAITGFAFDPLRVATHYYGTSAAVNARRSLNSGTNLVPFSDGIPASSPCHRLAVDSAGDTVYCGAVRRGVWRLAPN